MDGEAMMRAGRARQSGKACPKGGGYANGGRVAKAAYSGGAKEPVGQMDGPIPYAGSDGRAASHRTGGGYRSGGRVKGKGC